MPDARKKPELYRVHERERFIEQHSCPECGKKALTLDPRGGTRKSYIRNSVYRCIYCGARFRCVYELVEIEPLDGDRNDRI